MKATTCTSLLLVATALAAAVAACTVEAPPSGKSKHPKGNDDASGDFGGGSDSTYSDFPGAIIDGNAPKNAADLFEGVGDAKGAAGPCVIEPEAGTLFPKNWLTPRFAWVAASGQNLFELHVHADNQTNDLVVYTSATSWTMPSAMWSALGEHSSDVPMTFEVRAASYAGGALSNVTSAAGGAMGIAPVDAPGSIVFWSIVEEDASLQGFSVGEPGLVEVLRSQQLPTNGGQQRTCVGCHTSTPDGKYVGVAWEAGEDVTGIDVARIEKGQTAGPRPDFVTNAAASTFTSGYPMISAFSRGHWAQGDRMMITNDGADLVWIDLEAQTSGVARGSLGNSGDPNPRRAGPAWTRDGSRIVYMSGTLADNPFDLTGPSDLYVMPYANKAGATAASPAKPLAGASDPTRAEYYPALSPDDAWVAFSGLPDNGRIYDNPNAEIFVVPTNGGERVRLKANDPPACSGKHSPGITNSWPKWAPEVMTSGDRKFYFVVFSSRRNLATDRPQLYVAPIKVDTTGKVTTYPAIFLRNQESLADWKTRGNHTPAWDVFEIPPAVVR